ncbi:hypothetical protein, partial [Aeromicrobium sp. REDSEA-S32_B7]|uniref:hypothetical protein n=1 Tax=Aeromicrobium sp. REDSEA-S32_B7 TaxID=1811526 RepID=UPI002954B64C
MARIDATIEPEADLTRSASGSMVASIRATSSPRSRTTDPRAERTPSVAANASAAAESTLPASASLRPSSPLPSSRSRETVGRVRWARIQRSATSATTTATAAAPHATA